MSKVFCPECGTKHDFLDKRPKFCTDCGYSFGANAAKPRQIETVETVETEDLDYNIPTIDLDELNIGSRNVLTIQQALANPAPDSNFRRSSPGHKGLKRLQEDVRIRKNNEL